MSSSPPPTVYGQRYELVRRLARGGMADVYLAHDAKLDRPVAVKVLFPELSRDPAFVERFRREAQAAAGLNHPNIVAVYDWGEEVDASFIVMEHIEGRSLRDVLRNDGPLPPASVAEIGSEIASALAYAHHRGVVHRDVKPGNVMVTPSGQVKVTDFGIARAVGAVDGLTRTGNVMGTAAYFSPEQAQGLPVDGRSDVYSLGVVLYEMATGAPPFTGENPVSVAYQHVREAVTPPSRHNPAVPLDLERAILGALAKQPDDRYPSADDLRADLLRFLRGQPVIGPGEALTAALVDVTEPGTTAAPTIAAPAVLPGPVTPGTALPAPRRRRGPIIAAPVALLVLIGILLAVLLTQLGGGGSSSVSVPNVVGQPVDVATAALRAKGLTASTQTQASDQAAGTVLRQDPAAGAKLKKGGTVRLTVSGGAGQVTVPDVSDQTFSSARATLENLGLKTQRQDEASDTIPSGLVTRTDPPANTKVDKGSVVTIFVSTGQASLTVPDVTGNDQVAATQTLNNAGFVVQKATEANDTVPPGAVIRTDPAAGQKARRGGVVKMVVSSGPTPVTVPPVVGDKEAQATRTLTGAGLNVAVVPMPSGPSNDGRVVSQTPAAGMQVDRGSTVTITVGTGTGAGTTSTT